MQNKLNDYRQIVNFSKVRQAQHEVELVTHIAKETLLTQASNVEAGRQLVEKSQGISSDANGFYKKAKQVEQVFESRNFWAGSPKCLLLFGGTGGIGVILYYIIMFFIRR